MTPNLTLVIHYFDAAEPKTITKIEDPEGAAIVIEEIWTRGFDVGDKTVAPENIKAVHILADMF